MTDEDQPKLDDNVKTTKEKDVVSVSCTLPKELFEKVEAEAEDQDRTISQQIKRIVRLYYEKKK